MTKLIAPPLTPGEEGGGVYSFTKGPPGGLRGLKSAFRALMMSALSQHSRRRVNTMHRWSACASSLEEGGGDEGPPYHKYGPLSHLRHRHLYRQNVIKATNRERKASLFTSRALTTCIFYFKKKVKAVFEADYGSDLLL